ncbi:hypothetical protein DFH06DRAFT_1243727 [Mycena polygramma]|nr:hypothetical protein DFH06DRAFT_1243727 [Mycena polygramma]
MYDFSGSGDDSELAFRAGDMIAVVDVRPDGWWMGELNRIQGLFPASYTDLAPDMLQLAKHSGSSGNGAETGISGPRYTDDDEDLSAAPTFGPVSSTTIMPRYEQQAAPRKGSATVPGKSSPPPLFVACNFCRGRKIACDGKRPSWFVVWLISKLTLILGQLKLCEALTALQLCLNRT